MLTNLNLIPIPYESLNARQQENYNFQKISAVLADYGFNTLRLSDDWQGADFIACSNDGERFLKVQLKGRLYVDRKYLAKDIWIAFRRQSDWYLYPHDIALAWALETSRIGKAAGWDEEASTGAYSWPNPTKKFLAWLEPYRIPAVPSGLAA